MLPALEVTGADVEAVKFAQVLRGYKTNEVDWVLDRLGAEIDQLRAELDPSGTFANPYTDRVLGPVAAN